MKYKKVALDTSHYVRYYVVLETGDEIISMLKEFAQREKIKGASISGIGTLKNPELGFFDLKKKEYIKKVFSGDFELGSLLGNITVANGEVAVHTHVLISDSQFETFAGHLFKGEITGTGEIIIDTLGENVERKYNKSANLNLIEL